MKVYDILSEDGRIVKGVNTTVDVGPNEIKTQAAKFGNSVDKDGVPPTLSKKVKGKSTNVLYNLGLAEGKRPTDVDPAQNPYVKQEKDTDIVFYCEFDDVGKRTCKKVKRGDIKDKINYLHKHADMVNGNMMDIYTDTLNSPDKLYSIVTFTKEINGKMYKVWADQNTKKIIKKELMY
jgi:hypothetical protein